ncbi:homeobox-leucine zipper protein HAT4-like isoform X2 [Apium graveolens]|uniref:homeobox-leucine zipper protein HAT4-like isoform X2 n=1 Tax=Apium graveolens TaxID=4045 RepID=UPI003D7A9044
MMIQQSEEFGLSLSLSFPGSSDHEHKLANTNNICNQTANLSSSQELNLKPSSATNHLPKISTLPSHSSGPKVETCRVDRRRSLTGIDVNRSPTGDVEDELVVSPPNSTLSSLSGNKRSLIREVANGEDVMEFSRSEDHENGDNCGKKLRLSKDQAVILEESFKEHSTLNPKQKIDLGKRLGLGPRQVEVWFQNRRARTKLKQTAVDCEFLKRCCQTLMEENRKLRNEVQELRAFKLSPQFSAQMIPPTTLTVCPSCQHFAVPSSAPTSSVCPSTTKAEPPQVHAMSTITVDSISTCVPPTGLDTTLSVYPSTTKAEPPPVHAMSTITVDSISTAVPPTTGLDWENRMARTLFL